MQRRGGWSTSPTRGPRRLLPSMLITQRLLCPQQQPQAAQQELMPLCRPSQH